MSITFEGSPPERAAKRHEMPLAVQILSTLTFGAFAIVSVVMGFVFFWPAGVVLAVVLAWRGGFGPQTFPQVDVEDIAARLRHLGPEAEQRRSKNASFDAYRNDVLNRLEDERVKFESFLGRLRDAKDQSEFDRFMDQRAQAIEPQKEDAHDT